LSEILSGIGTEKLEGILPEIIANANHPTPHIRDGYLSLFVFLPGNYGDRFQPYLPQIIPPILAGLADESEMVRDTSLRAGQMIVTHYAYSSIEVVFLFIYLFIYLFICLFFFWKKNNQKLLLPQLEVSMFDPNWRIRQSSTQLVGDLLYRITGATGKTQVLLFSFFLFLSFFFSFFSYWDF